MKTETAEQEPPPWSWHEDVLLVILFALVGAMGMAAGVAADSQVETSIGLVMVGFAAKVLTDVLKERRARRAQNE